MVASILFGLAGPALADALTPVGDWRTFDDHTGKERSVIRIVERHGALFGSILSSPDPDAYKETCTKCDDDRKGKPIIGLEIIRDFRQQGDEWTGGRILDPEDGGLYKATIRVTDGGSKLVLHGYIGIPLLGRSQTWTRAAP
jgi:uncharacterized protein (DUF2147 family)